MSSGKRVAVVGSGPAGLAAAQQLTRAGHEVTVYERDDRLGGLLRYGIPEFKMEKKVLDRRLAQLREEGTRFVTGCEVGGRPAPSSELRAEFDAVVLAVGALRGRDDTDHPGPLAGRRPPGDGPPGARRTGRARATARRRSRAAGKHVIIIGGGDTGADCYGTATRQGALSVTQLDQYPQPPTQRDDERSPWPVWPWILRTYPAHEEAGERRFAVAVERFVGDDDGHVRAIELRKVRVEKDSAPGAARWSRCRDEVEVLPGGHGAAGDRLRGRASTCRCSTAWASRSPRAARSSCGSDWQTTAPGVFVCGDAHRGASLVVWAIAEGRSVANAVDSVPDRLVGPAVAGDPQPASARGGLT